MSTLVKQLVKQAHLQMTESEWNSEDLGKQTIRKLCLQKQEILYAGEQFPSVINKVLYQKKIRRKQPISNLNGAANADVEKP